MAEEEVKEKEATETDKDVKYGPEDEQVIIVTDKGYAMRTTLASFRIGRRKTTGVQAIKMKKEEGDKEEDSKDRGTPIAVKVVEEGELMFVLTKKGVGALIPSNVVRLTGRKKAGVRIMKLDDDDVIVSVA